MKKKPRKTSNSIDTTPLWGLIWYSAYEEYEILAVFQKKEFADFVCNKVNITRPVYRPEDEAMRVAPVVSDGKGWFKEPEQKKN